MSNKKLILINVSIAVTVFLAWLIFSEWEKMEIGMKFVVTFFIAVTLSLLVVVVV